MNLKISLLSACVVATGFAGAASAATIDFTDPFTAVTASNAPAIPVVISEESDGVTFTITATARGFDRFVQVANGLKFGIPGNGMRSISVVADADVNFTGFTARDRFPTLNGSPSYQASVGGTIVSPSNPISGGTLMSYAFGNGPIAVTAGTAFLLEPEYFGVLIASNLASLQFETVMSAVPLPAGMPLMLAGFGLLALKRKRK